MAGGEDERALGVVTGPLQLLVPPLLDSIDLRRVHRLEFCRRHSAALRLGDRCHSRIRPLRRIGRPLFGGIFESLTGASTPRNSAVVLSGENARSAADVVPVWALEALLLKRTRLAGQFDSQPVRNDWIAPAIHFLSMGTEVKPA